MFDRIPGSLDVTIVKRPASTTIRNLPTDPLPPAPTTIVKSGCLVETQSQAESVGLSTTNTELVWIFLPPDSDTVAIGSTDVLRFNGRDYHMQGPAAVEYSIDGDAIIVWCICRWEAS
jgi:hypothetical protein